MLIFRFLVETRTRERRALQYHVIWNSYSSRDDSVSTKSCEPRYDIVRRRTATRSCRTRKLAVHLYSPGVVRRSHAEARHVRALLYACRCCCCCPAADDDTALGN